MSIYDPLLHDEVGRLTALDRYRVLDTTPERNFELITGLVRDLLDVPMCAVTLIDANRLWFKSQQGMPGSEAPRAIGFCDHTIRSHERLVVADMTSDRRFADNPLVVGELGVRSYAGVPLTTPEGYNVGALCAIDQRPREFSAQDLGLLDRFAALVVEQLELRTLAMTDSLTGALSRRGFVDAARTAFCGFHQHQQDAALVTFDLDHFKEINDRFGHGCGNDVLQDIGSVCLRMLRPSDRFGRLGGEEFGLLLSGCDLRQAKHCAERLRQSLAEADHPLCGPVTASFGVAMLTPGADVDTWQQQADRALYAAKHRGRNCTIVYNPAIHGPTPQRRRKDMGELLETCARWRTE